MFIGNVREKSWGHTSKKSRKQESRVEKLSILCLIITLFNPQPTKERNWENEEEI